MSLTEYPLPEEIRVQIQGKTASFSIHLKNRLRYNDQQSGKEHYVSPKLPPYPRPATNGQLCERTTLDRLNIAVQQKNVIPDFIRFSEPWSTQARTVLNQNRSERYF